MTDIELLRQYACAGSEQAFGELVGRYLNLVYSAARRQIGSSALAEEVAQEVFLDLARSASRLKPEPSLGSWLYVVTRRRAIDAVRSERRRALRETTAYEISTMNAVPSSWSRLEPVLDQAMAALTPGERSAILLRYFENRSLGEIGAAFRISEDAAQKRVSRAIDRLKESLAVRGLPVSAAALANDLSAHAVVTAPVALAKAITTAAVIQHASLTTVAVLAMTLTQKVLIAASLAAAVTGVLYFRHASSVQAADNAVLRQRVDQLANRNIALSRGASVPAAAVEALPAVEPPPPVPPAPAATAAGAAARERMIADDRRSQLEELYGSFFGRLNLNAEKLEKFKDLLVARQSASFSFFIAARENGTSTADALAMAHAEEAAREKDINDLLGDEGYAAYREYYGTTPERAVVVKLDQKLRFTDSALTATQVEQMIQALTPTDLSRRNNNSLDAGPVVIGGKGAGSAGVQPVYFSPKITPAMVAAVQPVLTPTQLAAFQQLQSEWQAHMDAATANSVSDGNGVSRPR